MALVHLLVVLLAAAIALGWLARRLRVPYPIALVLGGTALGFVPGLPRPTLDPNLVLVVFLPPILYQAALFTSWRDFRANARAISLLAVGLVLATTVVIAATARWLFPEMPWAVAFALGAIVSPPDAVAATAILSRVNIRRRIVAILEGESLVNDATGLVFYKFAVAAAVTGAFSLAEATGQFIVVGAGGLALGYVFGRVFVVLHRQLRDPLIEILLSLLLPYAAYLAADLAGVSSVLAVVAAGLVRGRHAPEAFAPETRLLAYSVWSVFVFVLNGLIFILIGLLLPDIVAGVRAYTWPALIDEVVLLSVVLFGVRVVWVYVGAYLPRRVLASAGRSERSPSLREVAVVAWTGMRGIVSLAAALALPLTLADGTPFPSRDLTIFLAFGMIFVSLVVPGLTLGPLIALLKVGGDWGVHEERTLARRETARAALEEIDRLERERDITPDIAAHLRRDYEVRAARAEPGDLVMAAGDDPWRTARLALVRVERQRLVAIWHAGRIGDEVLHEIERELDFEASRLG